MEQLNINLADKRRTLHPETGTDDNDSFHCTDSFYIVQILYNT